MLPAAQTPRNTSSSGADTSKYHTDTACFGRHGTFLASLAAVSLLTVTSRHHEHRSNNSVTFHHSRVVERQLPAHPGRETEYEHHGTRVTVRNLFGNLPVRVKQRAVAVEQKTEHQRLWLDLKRDITALVLTSQRPVSLRVRDAAHTTVLKFRDKPQRPLSVSEHGSGSRRPSSNFQFLLDTLSQAGYVNVETWPSWVPISASTQSVSIKGAISLDPAPNKWTQFISLGSRPLMSDTGNELYDQVNRLFRLSSFGTVEEEGDVDEDEKLRRANDKRFKSDGFTNKQLKGRKGVDRYPMFYLRISLKDKAQHKFSPGQILTKENILHTIITVLDAMLSEWLSIHHFRPRTKRPKTPRPASAPVEGNAQPGTFTSGSLNTSGIDPTSVRPYSAVQGERKRKLSEMDSNKSKSQSVVSNPSSFHNWSRIKSGKSEFYNSIWSTQKTWCNSPLQQSPPGNRNEQSITTPVSPSKYVPIFNMAPIPRGSLCALTAPPQATEEQSACPQPPEPAAMAKKDETVRWLDPSTKKVHLLNARTGCIVPESTSHHARLSSTPSSTRFQKSGKPLKMPGAATRKEPASNAWLDGVLKQWKNPVFQPVERRIRQLPTVEEDVTEDRPHRPNLQFDKNLDTDTLTKAVARFSRDDLARAHVLAQLDKKFILVKMPSSADGNANLLVLIDQHAADERVQVEALLTELCTPLPKSEGLYASRSGHSPQVAFAVLDTPLNFSIPQRESELFATYAAHFAAWGIVFDLIPAKEKEPFSTAHKTSSSMTLLAVTALPSCISERCKADPKLLISFLRSSLWKYADNTLTSLPLQQSSGPAHDDETPMWLRRLSSCPQGLVDLVNSRACRSAIMFNDELSVPECKQLVAKLSKCTFPFMCAHGRPSMIPLVNLGAEGTLGGGLGLTPEQLPGDKRRNFVDAWKTWRSRSSMNDA